MDKERHVLAVYPHPDDESFGKAGTLALHTKAGTPVTLICATLGQMGRNMGKPFFATRETLPLVREKELRDACDEIGIADLRLFRLRDKTLEFEDPEMLADKIAEVISDVKPSLIISYYPGHGVHPDHDALAYAVVRAVKRLPKDQRPKMHFSAITGNAVDVLGKPDVIVDVSAVADIKLAAVKAHKSQSQAMLARMEENMESDPELRKQMEAQWNREVYWTYHIND